MDRRKFLRFLGLAPVAAIAAIALPKLVTAKGDGPTYLTKVHGAMTGRWSYHEANHVLGTKRSAGPAGSILVEDV